MTPLSKQRISPPLEAGRSILDTHNLPPQLTRALEYTSKRLTRKGVHLTLVCVKSEHELPHAPPSAGATPTTSPPQTPDYFGPGLPSPSRLALGLRHLVRRGTGGSSPSSSASSSSSYSSSPLDSASTALSSPMVSPQPREMTLPSPRRWILPLSPLPSMPMTPMTPLSFSTATTGTSSCATSCRPQASEPFGVRLVYAAPVSLKDERTIRAATAKAERKYRTGMGALSISTPLALGLSPILIRRSVEQNEVLFSSEGLTLLGLDRLYSFKAALAGYARSFAKPSCPKRPPIASPGLSDHPVNIAPPTPAIMGPDYTRLEDAVDSLRRLVLSNGDRPIARADLYRSFDWIGVHPTALADVEQMYKRAYGGPERRGPFEVLPPPVDVSEEPERLAESEARGRGFIKIGLPPPPKTPPVLKLNTNVATKPQLVRPKPRPMPISQVAVGGMDMRAVTEHAGTGINTEPNKSRTAPEEGFVVHLGDLAVSTDGSNRSSYSEEGDGHHTAHPLRDGPLRPSMAWPNGNPMGATIDELLSPCDNRQSQRLGPMTPNGYDDISPVTRGEWGYLFNGATWTQGRTAVVETC
ncbi:hypothetical protein F5Y17DRAFT_202931 [Xylariaceae sp. FL0594]|nr:hypothetical protein F5Y17DRAFT_202931 [Xylariaceae sp. FL0594]